MPAKPSWYSKLDDIIRELELLPRPFVDRATLEFLLGVGRRRAQQIMTACITERVGTSSLADRDALIAHLRRLAEGDDSYYERRRRRNVAEILAQLQKDRLERPQLLVEAPLRVLTQEFANLPAGVGLEPGRITVTFEQPRQALAETEPEARAIVAASFKRWEASIMAGFLRMHALGRLAPEADPRQLALATLAALQGGLLLAQVQRDPEPLAAALDAMLTLIATLSSTTSTSLNS